MQKKLPSNNIEGCRAAVYSPPAHLMCPLPPSLSLSSPVVKMECYGWWRRQRSLWLFGEFGQQIQNKLREGGERERRGGGEMVGE